VPPNAGDLLEWDFPEIHCFKETQVSADEVSQANQEAQRITYSFCLLSVDVTAETHIHLLLE